VGPLETGKPNAEQHNCSNREKGHTHGIHRVLLFVVVLPNNSLMFYLTGPARFCAVPPGRVSHRFRKDSLSLPQFPSILSGCENIQNKDTKITKDKFFSKSCKAVVQERRTGQCAAHYERQRNYGEDEDTFCDAHLFSNEEHDCNKE
jgi:hypothetical protein